MGAIEPLSQRMAEELSRKLDLPSLDFKFRSLWASDLDRKDPSIPGARAGRDGNFRKRYPLPGSWLNDQICSRALLGLSRISRMREQRSLSGKRTTIVSGVALQIKGDPEEYEALKLIEKATLTLLFVCRDLWGISAPRSFLRMGRIEISSGSYQEARTGWNSRPESSHC